MGAPVVHSDNGHYRVSLLLLHYFYESGFFTESRGVTGPGRSNK